MDEELLTDSNSFSYKYPIYDETNQEITEPDLTLGYLKKETFTTHHDMVPEVWHYEVISFEFTNGEVYAPSGLDDPHIEIVDAKKGIFKYVNLPEEESKVVAGQTISPQLDSPMIPAWDETNTIYRYVLYTEKELADKEFLENGPQRLLEAQQTIEDLILVIADLIGAEE